MHLGEAIASLQSMRHDRRDAAVLLARVVAPGWAPIQQRRLPTLDYRDSYPDRLIILADGDLPLEVAVSTWPSRDANPPQKAVRPGDYPACWLLGEHKGRPALVGQGYTTAVGYCWDMQNDPTGAVDKIVGWNLHSGLPEGAPISEGCITTADQATVDRVRAVLSGLKGSRRHPDGRWCYDVHVRHVTDLR